MNYRRWNVKRTVWWLSLCKWRCNVFNLSLEFTRPHDGTIIWFLGRSSYLCHNHDKFGDQSHCDSKNWIILIFHVTWCDDVFQGFSNFMGRSSLWVEVPHGKSTRFYVWCHWSGASRDKMYLICHVTSHKPHNGRIVRLYEWEILIVFYYLAKFGGHRHCGSGYVMLLIYLGSSNNTWWYGHVTLREEFPHGRSAST